MRSRPYGSNTASPKKGAAPFFRTSELKKMGAAPFSRDTTLEDQLFRQLGGRPVHAFQQVGSTMEVAHQLAAEGAPEGTLVVAARQEQGRGRQGRTWASPEGGAYCSLILRPARPPSETPQL
ncbi:MAG: hypothetical protein HYZ96_03580, partial [Candidatus Omnitrophica bacterium]|nr:hypothetical protein [Candidatus Omnitrophota bacterium]